MPINTTTALISQQLCRLYYRRNYIAIFGLILLSSHARSQSEQSVLALLNKEQGNKHDSIYYELFKLHRTTDKRKALLYAQKAYSASTVYKHFLLQVNLCFDVADWYHVNNQLDSATIYFHKAIKIASSHKFNDWLIYLYNELGAVHQRFDLYDSALHYFVLSHNLANDSHAFKAQAAASHNIGLIYYDLENYNESIDHFKEAIKIKIDNGITLGLNRAMINLARTLNAQGLYERANEQLQQVKINCKINCEDQILADLYYEFGYLSLMQNKIDEAVNFFSEALMLSRKNNIKQTTAQSLYHLSIIAFNNKKVEQSFNYITEAKTIAKEIKHRRLTRDIFNQLSTTFTKLGENDKAVQNEILYVRLRDSIFNMTVANNVKNIQIAEHSKKSNAVIKEQEIALSNSYVFIALLGCVVLLTFAVIYLIARALISSRKHRQEMELHVVQMLDYREYSEKKDFRSHMEYTSLVSRVTSFLNNPVASLFGIAQSIKNAPTAKALAEAADKMIRTCTDIQIVLRNMTELLLYKNHDPVADEVVITKLIGDVKKDFKKQKSFLILNVTVEPSVALAINSDQELIRAAIVQAINYFDHTRETPIIDLIFSQSDDTTLRIAIKHHSRSNRYIPHKNQFNHLTVFAISGKLGGAFEVVQFEDYTLFEIFIPSNLSSLSSRSPISNISIE